MRGDVWRFNLRYPDQYAWHERCCGDGDGRLRDDEQGTGARRVGRGFRSFLLGRDREHLCDDLFSTASGSLRVPIWSAGTFYDGYVWANGYRFAFYESGPQRAHDGLRGTCDCLYRYGPYAGNASFQLWDGISIGRNHDDPDGHWTFQCFADPHDAERSP